MNWFKVRNLHSNSAAIVQQFEKQGFSGAAQAEAWKTQVEGFMKLVGTSLKQTHPNLGKMSNYYWNSKCSFVVWESLEGGDLFERLSNDEAADLGEDRAKLILEQIIDALIHLEKAGIYETNIRPENIVFEDPTISSGTKFVGYGVHKLIPMSQIFHSSPVDKD